ncbi:hypothetical protein BJF86_13395 [Serinicoccus sp. CNJ-927]|nr:hypothetical protein BJF86_13395 [Serinicoccus sp. CNJ-927]
MRRLIGLLVLGWLLAWVTALPVAANPANCEKRSETTGQCLIFVMPPPPDYPPGGGGGGEEGGGTGENVCWDWVQEAEVACVVGGYYWSSSWACHTKYADPQPGWSDPVWSGRTDGAIYECARGVTLTDPLPTSSTLRWSAAPPWGAPPDPRELAEQAVESMQLRAIDIGITPLSYTETGSIGLVGLPQWLWVDDEGPSTWGPITRTATSGPYSVTATGTVDRIEWDMGDGQVIVCDTPGTPYQESFMDSRSPDCGHDYYEDDGFYDVSATSYWVIRWAGLGQSGTIELDFTQTTQIAIGEVQVITQ